MTLKHALTVDVEDWFQVLNLRDVIDREQWDELELRCGDSTRRILDLLERRSARATFFFLGWIAERLPELVAEVHSAGHEVGSHGYDHRVLPELGPDGFRDDVARTHEILEGITGVRPTSFRACTWSICRGTSWAPQILAELGYRLDSSIFPIRHPNYGVPGAPVDPYLLTLDGADLLEVPPLCLEVLGKRLPVGGGGYLRLFPLALLRRGLRQREARGWPGCVYLHPWEVDPEQPRQPVGGMRGFRHYVNLRRTTSKLDALLAEFSFVGLGEAMGQPRPRELQVFTPDQLFGAGQG